MSPLGGDFSSGGVVLGDNLGLAGATDAVFRMVGDGRPADIGGARRADAGRYRAVPGGEPAGGHAHWAGPVSLRQPPGAVSHPRRWRPDRDVVLVAARNPPSLDHR